MTPSSLFSNPTHEATQVPEQQKWKLTLAWALAVCMDWTYYCFHKIRHFGNQQYYFQEIFDSLWKQLNRNAWIRTESVFVLPSSCVSLIDCLAGVRWIENLCSPTKKKPTELSGHCNYYWGRGFTCFKVIGGNSVSYLKSCVMPWYKSYIVIFLCSLPPWFLVL